MYREILPEKMIDRSEIEAYSFSEHREYYAAWAATRSVGILFKDVQKFKVYRSLLLSQVENSLLENQFNSRKEFDVWHRSMVERIVKIARKEGIEFSFGRAAKVLAIHIKTLHIIPGKRTDLVKFAHPPIDRTVLTTGLPSECRRDKTNLSFTKFSREQYSKVFKCLESNLLRPTDPRWKIEVRWFGRTT